MYIFNPIQKDKTIISLDANAIRCCKFGKCNRDRANSIQKPISILFVFALIILTALRIQAQSASKPNIIFIVADDVGFEIPTVNGGQSYSTPNIDFMAHNGMNFTHCEASPLCSPSRFMLLTGKYNFRNYSIWGYMNKGEKTIGNLMKDAGYKTAWIGKFQLHGHDADIHNFGFDKYVIFESLDLPRNSRYKSPLLYQNGETKLPDSVTIDQYADDILTKQVCNFIDSNLHNPFFVYYPMSLCHAPFSPTPEDSDYLSWDGTKVKASDAHYFQAMVHYMDEKVGQIIAKLKSTGLDKNTILVFVGDNASPKQISSIFDGEEYSGDKHSTTEGGTHVPLMVYWPGHIRHGGVINDQLVDFTDFFPTLADAARVTDLGKYGVLDGKSFFSHIIDNPNKPRDWIFCHFDAFAGFHKDTMTRWVQDKTYKLYDNTGIYKSGRVYDIVNDREELEPLSIKTLPRAVQNHIIYLQSILDTMPKPPLTPVLAGAYAEDVTDSSATIGATISFNGGSPIIERGSTIASYRATVLYESQRLSDSLLGSLPIKQKRTGFRPESHISFSVYAMNANKSNSTGSVQGDFFTCSRAPLKQPTSFAAFPVSCGVNLQWAAAKFPNGGATQCGYLLVYSTGVPSLLENPNHVKPANAIIAGTLVKMPSSTLPNLPGSSVFVPNLSKDSSYNFLLIPYTWDGINEGTYNYLTAHALTVSSAPLPPTLQLSLTIEAPRCGNDKLFTITASASNGVQPYLYSINKSTTYTATSVFKKNADTFLINLKDASGCIVSQSTVLISPAPLSLTLNRTNVSCRNGKDGSVLLAGKGGMLPYLYSINNGPYKTPALFSRLGAGKYYASVKDKNGCVSSTSVTITEPKSPCYVLTTSMEILNQSALSATNLTLNVTPNPSQDQFQLSIGGGKVGQKVFITAVDMFGKIVFQANGTKQTYLFGNDFAPGIYIVHVQYGTGAKTLKIVKTRQ